VPTAAGRARCKTVADGSLKKVDEDHHAAEKLATTNIIIRKNKSATPSKRPDDE
jgi:hypothetical protein